MTHLHARDEVVATRGQIVISCRCGWTDAVSRYPDPAKARRNAAALLAAHKADSKPAPQRRPRVPVAPADAQAYYCCPSCGRKGVYLRLAAGGEDHYQCRYASYGCQFAAYTSDEYQRDIDARTALAKANPDIPVSTFL